MVQPLSGPSRLLASGRIWPDGVTGLEEITPSQPSVRLRLEMLPSPSGIGGVRAVMVAFWLQSASEEALIIGQEEKSTVFLGL